MLPIFSDNGNGGMAQGQQMRATEYSSYTFPSGPAFVTMQQQQQPQQQQQQQQQQGQYIRGNSVLIDPSTTFLVQSPHHHQQQQQQAQQQKVHTLYTYTSPPQANSVPANVSIFSNSTTSSGPVYTASSVGATPFGAAGGLRSPDASTRSQRLGSVLNSLPTSPQHQQQQQQQLPSVFLHSGSAPLVGNPYVQQQRGNSFSMGSAVYTPLSRQSQQQVLSPTLPHSSSSGGAGGPVYAPQPLSPLSSASGVAPGSHSAAQIRANSTPSLACSTPPSAVLQHPQQLITNAGAGGTEVLNTLDPAAPTLASHHSSGHLASVVASGVVDAEEARLAHDRPFRFKMLPPPPTLDRYLTQWEANAADAHYRPWRRSEALGSSNSASAALNTNLGGAAGGEATGERVCVLTAEDVLQRTAAAAKATILTGTGGAASFGAPAGAPVARSMEERLALAEQYHRILERWCYYMSVFESKAEVHQRLGSLQKCPTYADAQRAVSTHQCDLPSGVRPEQLTPEERALHVWSDLAARWWEETKRRRRTRRGRRGSRRDAASSSVNGPSVEDGCAATLDDDDDDGDAAPPLVENDEETSVTSGNSFDVPSTEGSRRTRSVTDDAVLNFDFTS